MKKFIVVLMVGVSINLAYCNIDDGENENTCQSFRKDPFESINRPVFEFNKSLDKYALKNVAKVYKNVANDDFKECSYNFFYNLSLPLNVISSVCTLDLENAVKSVARFVINTIFGFLGCFDPASKMGIYSENKDIRDVLKAAGIPQGPFIMIPVIGGTSPRDIIGTIGNFFLDPFGFLVPERWVWRRRITNVIVDRTENYNVINEILYESADPYEIVRDNSRDKQ